MVRAFFQPYYSYTIPLYLIVSDSAEWMYFRVFNKAVDIGRLLVLKSFSIGIVKMHFQTLVTYKRLGEVSEKKLQFQGS